MYHLIFSSHSNPNKIFPKEFLIRVFRKREFLQAMCFEHLCLICASVITVYAHIDIGTYFSLTSNFLPLTLPSGNALRNAYPQILFCDLYFL